MKIRPLGVELFLAGGSTDGHTHTHTHTHTHEEANIRVSQYFERV